MIAAQAGDVDVRVAVVVVIGGGAAQPVHLDREPCFFGHVGEAAVLVVVIEGRERLRAFVVGPVRRVDEQDVLPAVIVIVEKSAARADGFRQVMFTIRAAVVLETNAGLRRDVAELNRPAVARRFGRRGRLRLHDSLFARCFFGSRFLSFARASRIIGRRRLHAARQRQCE